MANQIFHLKQKFGRLKKIKVLKTMRIKNSISNVLSISFVALLFLFAFTWIIFDFNGSSSSLKDTWSIVTSIFGGVTTLIAAYIAYSLYDDWRKPQNFNIEADHKREILRFIRKIIPLEKKYNRLIMNHFIYSNDPDRTIAIDINDVELNTFINNINELLGLMDELYYMTKDPNIKNLNDHYLNYAQLYTYILIHSESLYKENEKQKLKEFLGTNLKFDFIDINGEQWSSSTLYAYAFKGMQQVKMRQYFSENIKSELD